MVYEVTIGIPVFNVEKYIRESLESALAQSFQSIEFLICDDCSTDSSIAIVREYQEKNARGKDIRIVSQPYNMGIGCARNRIVTEAKGRYLYFMDSDDILSINSIECLYMQATKFDAEMVFGSMEKVLLYDHGQHIKNADYAYNVFLHEDEFASWVYQKYDRIQASACNFLIKVDVYKQSGIQYMPISYWEDFMAMMDLPTYVTNVVMLPNVTYFYMCREGSLSNYQQRKIIQKEEILQTMKAVSMIKENSKRFLRKPYFSDRMLKVMMTCFYVCCTILRNRDVINPEFKRRELRDFMTYPVSWAVVCSFRHLPLYLLGKLPPFVSVCFMYIMGKTKHLV